MEYEDDNFQEIVDDEDEEMVNENCQDHGSNSVSKIDGNEKLGPPNIQIKPPGTKQKRRSKNDCNGRDYVCGCGKTYLSYPALYTHIKTKHNGKTPDGTNANQVQSGTGRGRPRKNFLIKEDDIIKKNRENMKYEAPLEEKHPELKETLYRKEDNGKSDNEEIYLNIYRKLRLTNENEYEIGNEVIPTDGFPEGVNKNTRSSYEILKQRVKFIYSNGVYDPVLSGNYNIAQNDNDDLKFSNSQVVTRNKITCDDIFACFLIHMARIANEKFYKTIIVLIKHFRECMNKLGWDILSQFKHLSDEQTTLDFCSVKNGEHLPEIASDFINVYLPSKLPQFDKKIASVIVSQFCDWLHKHKLTHIKLRYINPYE